MSNSGAGFIRAGILCGVLGTSVLHGAEQPPCAPSTAERSRTTTQSLSDAACAGQEGHPVVLSSYRGLQFGMSLAAAVEHAGMQLTEARVVHQKPALIQDLDWRPRRLLTSNTPAEIVTADPVKDGVLSFYNGELFRIVVNYDRYRVEAMTAEDMIQGISGTYGMATRPTLEIPYHSNYGEVASVLARWENPEYSYNLVRTGDRSSFSLVLYSKRLDTLAQAAIVQAVRLEAEAAPQREIERQKQRDEDDRLLLEKARSANKPNFQP
jgi:hypothetical protein